MSSAAVQIASSDLIQSLVHLDQALLDALPIGIYVCGADGRILRFNDRAVELWGRRPVLSDHAPRFCACHRVETLDGAHILPEATPMARAVREGLSFRDIEARVQNPDGRRWVASVTIQPLLAPDGAIAGAINCFNDVTRDHDARENMARQQRSFDLAMVASKMGTWRYTLADNICVYDENAQRLYGLTQARFLHDDAGVREKFHPDDMDLMWSRVGKALAPDGDGFYEVEYRVKQLDGSWRWLSAWGHVEFEGAGENRKPLAITGASRDITDLMKADEAQKILINELNHRVKNMLATVQSIAMQTQRSTPAHFAERFEARLMGLSRAHDLLTRRQWTGVTLHELLEQTLAPYDGDNDMTIRIEGPGVMLSARAALALGMVAHELATNAAKYGALSSKAGHVKLDWSLERRDTGEWLALNWTEAGGPAVAPPTRRGFGSRLIERTIAADLGGKAGMDYAAGGLRCRLEFPLGRQQLMLRGIRVAVIEDEAAIAMMIEDMLEDMGCVVAGSAASLQDAQRLVAAAGFDLALLDMNLNGHKTDSIADALAEKGVPFAFASGYGRAGLPERFKDHAVVQKPFVSSDLEKILRALTAI